MSIPNDVNLERIISVADSAGSLLEKADGRSAAGTDLAINMIGIAQTIITNAGVAVEGPTFQAYLTADIERGVMNHLIRAHRQADGTIRFYIHPADDDGTTFDFTGGTTLDFTVEGNVLTLIKA